MSSCALASIFSTDSTGWKRSSKRQEEMLTTNCVIRLICSVSELLSTLSSIVSEKREKNTRAIRNSAWELLKQVVPKLFAAMLQGTMTNSQGCHNIPWKPLFSQLSWELPSWLGQYQSRSQGSVGSCLILLQCHAVWKNNIVTRICLGTNALSNQ